jgi:hypothetical protein
MDANALLAKIAELEASLAAVTGTVQQLTAQPAAQQPAHRLAQVPRPPKPDKYDGDRRSGAAANWLHQMRLYLNILGLLESEQAIPQAVSFHSGAAITWWRILEASAAVPTTWTAFQAAFLEAFQTVDAEHVARNRMESLRQRTSVMDYANAFSGLLLEVPDMHPADAVYRFVRGLKPQVRLHVELHRPSTVNDAIRLAQAADSALYLARPNYVAGSSGYPGPQPMQLGALTKLSPADRERLLKEGKCFRCRQPGHRAQECTAFRAQGPAASQEQPKN